VVVTWHGKTSLGTARPERPSDSPRWTPGCFGVVFNRIPAKRHDYGYGYGYGYG
jgi:hypothetical protein